MAASQIGTPTFGYTFQNAGQTSVTLSGYTIPDGPMRKVFITTLYNGTTANIAAASGVTLNGVSATAITGYTGTAAAGGLTVRIDGYMVDQALIPSSGDIIVSGLVAATTRETWIFVTTYQWIWQGQPIQVDADSVTTGTTITNTLAPARADVIQSAYVANMSAGTQSWSISAGGEAEQFDNDQSATAGAAFKLADGTETSLTSTSSLAISRGVRCTARWPSLVHRRALLGVGR